MMYEELIRNICEREINYGCFNYSIEGINVYNYVKRKYRQLAVKEKGCEQGSGADFKSLLVITKTVFKSFYQLICIIILKKKSDNLIHAFSRMDSVNGIYVDKFTDPIIDYSSVGGSYIVFQRGWNHPKPRIHSEKVVFSDGIYVLAMIWSLLFSPLFHIKYRKTFSELYNSLTRAFPSVYLNKRTIIQTVLYSLSVTNLYGFFLKELQVKNVLAPSRADFLFIIPAAKKNSIQILELQHGVTYDETITYSGFRDPLFTPDRFLSFGDMQRNDVYGIDENSIVNIGWAFNEYIKSFEQKPLDNSVLVVSEPSHSEQLFDSMVILAKENPGISFYFRPHPLEHITYNQKGIIDTTSNVSIDDNSCNIWISLLQFNHVIGVDSTVLYEALSLNKNVGKVFMSGLQPKYLQAADYRCFDRIDGIDSFKVFMQRKTPEVTRRIHSQFNKELFESLLKK